jgi:POT family proton-dependent oligopeptide transporter
VLYLALYDLADESGGKSDGASRTTFFTGVGLLFATAAALIVRGSQEGLSQIPGLGDALAQLSASLQSKTVETILLVLGIGALLIIAVSCVMEARKYTNYARDRVFAMIFLILLMPLFWGLFEQAGGSLNLFTDRHVDRGSIPTTFFQSINSIYIILLGPVFVGLWQFLSRRGIEPSTPAKMGLGIVQMGLAFVVMVWGANNFSTTGADGAILMPVLFLFIFYLLATTGELCLSPVGLSAINRLSARHMASLMMAAFFFGTAGGNYVAGFMGSLMGEGEGGDMTRELALQAYWNMGLVAVVIGIVIVMVSPLVKKLMHIDALKDDDAGLAGATEAGLEVQEGGTRPATN